MNNTPPGRRTLPHEPPHFIGTADAIFFLTVCCRSRGKNQLCRPAAASILFEAARFYHDRQQWHVDLLLLIPDHAHLLVRFGSALTMEKVVENWKRYTAAKAGVRWQRGFFDHRLREEESFSEKEAYIRQNPVRAKLIEKPEDWLYQRDVLNRHMLRLIS